MDRSSKQQDLALATTVVERRKAFCSYTVVIYDLSRADSPPFFMIQVKCRRAKGIVIQF